MGGCKKKKKKLRNLKNKINNFQISLLHGVKSEDKCISIATSKLNPQITTIMLSVSYPTVQFCFVDFYLPLRTLLATERTAFQCFLPFPLNKLALAPSIWFPFRQQPCTCSHLLSCWIPLNIPSSARLFWHSQPFCHSIHLSEVNFVYRKLLLSSSRSRAPQGHCQTNCRPGSPSSLANQQKTRSCGVMYLWHVLWGSGRQWFGVKAARGGVLMIICRTRQLICTFPSRVSALLIISGRNYTHKKQNKSFKVKSKYHKQAYTM